MALFDAHTRMEKKISSWTAPFDQIGKKVHESITPTAPQLEVSTMYGSPSYKLADEQYMFTLGINQENPRLEALFPTDGMLASAYYLQSLTPEAKLKIAEITRAVAG